MNSPPGGVFEHGESASLNKKWLTLHRSDVVLATGDNQPLGLSSFRAFWNESFTGKTASYFLNFSGKGPSCGPSG